MIYGSGGILTGGSGIVGPLVSQVVPLSLISLVGVLLKKSKYIHVYNYWTIRIQLYRCQLPCGGVFNNANINVVKTHNLGELALKRSGQLLPFPWVEEELGGWLT